MPQTSPPPRPSAPERAQPAAQGDHPGPLLTCAAAWLVPGAGHFLQGQARKGATLFGVLVFMFAFGLWLDGRIFPVQLSDILVGLAAVSQWLLGLPHVLASMSGWGPGEVRAIGYEYGNAFLIVGGLLNALVMLDAYDLATGRKPR